MERFKLREEYPSQVATVRKYLKAALPDSELAESEDFDRDGLKFRIEPRRLIFVSHEFLSDFSEQDAAGRLKAWGVAEKAKQLPVGFTLFVTTEGTFVNPAR